MAGGIDWFRWHHGSVTDPKFQLVARKAGASLPDVLAVWAYILEQASASDVRGTFCIDAEAVDCMFGFPSTETRTADILAAMASRGLVEGCAVASWEKRQPRREREDDKSTSRVQAFRQKQRQETPGNATERQETPRGEESREEGIPTELKLSPGFPAEKPALSLVAESQAPRPKAPDCPHLALLALWAEVLPAMPAHNVELWRGARADHMRARWRETATAKAWATEADGIEYFRRLFGYVGRSKFLTGRAQQKGDKPPFVCTLEWLVKPANWAKVIEGNYHPEAA